MLVPLDKAASNFAIDRKMHYINIIKQELGSAKTYENNLLDERSVVERHRFHVAAKLGVLVDKNHD